MGIHRWFGVAMLAGFVLLGAVSGASASSYQMIDGTIVDPIQSRNGGDSVYSGNNLEPSADLVYAGLAYADLSSADLSNADLSHANLSNASLSYSNLSSTLLYSADLSGTASWLWATWTGAKYSLNAVDNAGNPIPDTIFPAGMDQAWRDAAGMIPVPEPGTALLVGLGLIGLGVRRRVS